MTVISRKCLAIVSASIVTVALALVVIIWRMHASDGVESALPSSSDSQSALPAAAISAPVNMQKLVGQWLRTDSSYIIEIHEVGPDGTLRAGYYNPRAINVSAAKVEEKNGALEVFVELHDAGYPGSNYTLNYDARNDVLEGTYFQATMRQNFDVTFMRMPAER
ncbi:MAG: hypothetical protein ACYTDV_19585 [Planctomycetota bacterium]